MADVLDFPSGSPLRDLFDRQAFLVPYSPASSTTSSTATVQRHRDREESRSSLLSTVSYLSLGNARRRTPEISLSSPTTSTSHMYGEVPQGQQQSLSIGFSEASFASADSQTHRSESPSSVIHRPIHDSGSSSDDVDSPGHSVHLSGRVNTTEETEHILDATLNAPSTILEESIQSSTSPKAFRRWVSTLRRRKQKQPQPLTPRTERWTYDDFDYHTPPKSTERSGRKHKKSDSWTSSIGFVANVKSATVTIASASIAPLSRRTSKWRRGHNRSSIISGSDPRPSIDTQQSVFDEAARQRSRKRREKVEELIRTEESYVADVKALSNAYFTLLGHQQSAASFARSSAQKTIADILHLHDALLGELHKVVPFAEYDQVVAKAAVPPKKPLHHRWHSVDVVPQVSPMKRTTLTTIRQGRRSLNISRSSETEAVVLLCPTQVVGEIAKLFSSYMPRLRVYEDYGANYDIVQRDIEETQRTIATWPEFDRAIEALSTTINPVRTREANSKKALTVKDLLIKPIQRLPRYELLLHDLCRLTPVCDDPDTHALIEDARSQIIEVCQNMNQAKDNPERTRALEATWMLGERLSFAGQVPRSIFLQLLGPLTLCGCLYIAYRSKDFIKGKYVVCMLFETTLLLATATEDSPKYSVLLGISLASATIEESDNGKGLQCHTAPHSWKVVFEHTARMYELIFTACSAVEATVWRQQITTRIEAQTQAVSQGKSNVFELHSPLVTEMRTIGKAFGKPGSFVRRMSVHRTATVGPTTDLNQVIIKNTQAVKEALDNSSATSLQIPGRSQSVATPSHVHTLAPRRADRVRLEAILADVWTKELLPYPGMSVRRSDQLLGSANHVIRKFSMASITSNFSSSKRTASYTSMSGYLRKEDVPPFKSVSSRMAGHQQFSKPTSSRPLPLADLLPADFDLPDHSLREKRGKRSAFRALTMTMERPFSPLVGTGSFVESSNMPPPPVGLRRAQSVREQTAMPQNKTGLGGMGGRKDSVVESTASSSFHTERVRTPGYPAPSTRTATPGDTSIVETGRVGDGENVPKARKSKSKKMLMKLFG